jgi:hypothetical protein
VWRFFDNRPIIIDPSDAAFNNRLFDNRLLLYQFQIQADPTFDNRRELPIYLI